MTATKDRTLDLTSVVLKPKPTREPHRIEQVFDIEFNEHQLKFYWCVRTFVGFPKGVLSQADIDAAREWLANGRYQAQGRTTLLALCFLEKAAAEPGHRVDVFDHYATTTGQNAMMVVIRHFVDAHPLFKRQVAYYGADVAAFVFQPIRQAEIRQADTGFKEF